MESKIRHEENDNKDALHSDFMESIFIKWLFMKKRKGEKMNRHECKVLNVLMKENYINQRILAESCQFSLGTINNAIKELTKNGYLDEQMHLTVKAYDEAERRKPKNAIILAAGFGMRMVPINTEVPKGLLEIHGETLIERIIKQLNQVGINSIYVIVGFMKERYEYLIDEYGVKLLVNTEYSTKNNLYSLRKALKYIDNSYIIPCDIWCAENPFSNQEWYSWYMIRDSIDRDSNVKVNKKMELVLINNKDEGNSMVGICYLMGEQAKDVCKRIEALCENNKYEDAFWEESLYDKGKMLIQAKVVEAADVVEINTYEQLREIDEKSNQLKTDAIDIIKKIFDVKAKNIIDIKVLKKGMTNRSFLFSCNGKKYIMRIPGEGTDSLINRQEEAIVYQKIMGKGICDNPIYINPENGYKITEYLENVRVCDKNNSNDLQACMKKLREFHEMNLKVDHDFDIFEKIEFYEALWGDEPSIYRDYKKTKMNIFSLQKFINKQKIRKSLTHIDAVPDNFLFYKNKDGQEELQLTDWEYAGMQDPHVDIAMFSIYALYNREQIDNLIDIYFDGKCSKTTKIKIYCYIAACGLLWSNWCEYKRNLGVEFGEYSLKQYRYAKEYYRIVQNELANLEDEKDE